MNYGYRESPIEDYFELDSVATTQLPKKFQKQMEKTKEEIVPKIINDFKEADNRIRGLISKIEEALKRKSESDF